LKDSIGNGLDDVDDPRKVIGLQDLTYVKGKNSNSKWAPSTKKPAKSWGISAQNKGTTHTLCPRDCKSLD